MGLITKIKTGVGLIVGTYIIFSCADTIRPLRQDSHNSDLHFKENYVMYEARKGERIEDLYESEGGDINNKRQFRNFQEDIYNATGRISGYNCMKWNGEKLEIIKPCIIWGPDINRDNIFGEPKEEVKRPKLTNV